MTTDTDGARMAAHLMRITDAATALAAEAQRQVNQHGFALDALIAENQSLRIVAHNLRTQRDEDVARINALEAELARLQHLVDESRKAHEANAREVGQAAALVGKWPGTETDEQVEAAMREVDAKPVREVVRGTYFGWPAIAEAGKDPEKGGGRIAVDYGKGKDRDWSIYLNEEYPTGKGACQCLTEQQAIAWVLDGVLPATTP